METKSINSFTSTKRNPVSSSSSSKSSSICGSSFAFELVDVDGGGGGGGLSWVNEAGDSLSVELSPVSLDSSFFLFLILQKVSIAVQEVQIFVCLKQQFSLVIKLLPEGFHCGSSIGHNS